MSRFAIDVVIILPDPVMQLACSWNRKLAAAQRQSIVLNDPDSLPHISMLMGCLQADRIDDARIALARIAAAYAPVSLAITGVTSVNDTNPVAALDIAWSAELSGLQRSFIDGFGPLITQDTVEEDMFGGPPVSPSAINWINRFIPEQCYDRFWPHITVGHGRPDGAQDPYHFMATRIAICHLGDHCTCRRILAEAALTR
jgi:2'-5' RNA ligase